MKHFLLIANKGKPEAVRLADQVHERLRQLGCEGAWDITDETECVLVFGGDGTLLQAARDYRDRQLPFLGINAGSLGYLAEVDRDHVEEALQLLVNGRASYDARMMLKGQVLRGNQVIYEDVALNDIVVGSRGLTVLCFQLYVDGEYLTTYQADGMVIATPTGSTAYSLSAGGPVVNPCASLIVLTPVSPHTLISRSIVLESRSVLELRILRHPSRRDVEGCIGFDGNEIMSLQPEDRIRICRSERVTNIIRYSNVSFLETLRKKMGDH